MRDYMNMLAAKAMVAKYRLINRMKDESGETNIIAIILILAIVIALAIIFKDAIMGLFQKIWGSITGNVDEVLK